MAYQGFHAMGKEAPFAGQYRSPDGATLIVVGDGLATGAINVAVPHGSGYKAMVGWRWEYDVISLDGSAWTLRCTDETLFGGIKEGDTVTVRSINGGIEIQSSDDLYNGKYTRVHPKFDVEYGF